MKRLATLPKGLAPLPRRCRAGSHDPFTAEYRVFEIDQRRRIAENRKAEPGVLAVGRGTTQQPIAGLGRRFTKRSVAARALMMARRAVFNTTSRPKQFAVCGEE